MVHLYYHVTPVENLPAILAKGLLPKLGERSLELGVDSEAVHLYVTVDTLEDACMNDLPDLFGEDVELALIEVALGPEDCPLPEDDFDVALLDPIRASALRVLSRNLLEETSLDFLRTGGR